MLVRALKSKLLRASAIYGLSRVINAAIPFFLLPVLTRYLEPEDYGKTAMFGVLLAFAAPFIGLNLHGAVNVKYFDKNEKNLGGYIGNCFLILWVSTAVAALAMWLFAGPISGVSAFPVEWLWAVVLVPFVNFPGSLQTTLWQAQEKPLRFALYSNTSTALNLGLSLVFVVGMGRNWEGRVEAQVITAVVFGALALLFLWRSGLLRIDYDRASIRHALRFGIPLIPHAIGAIMISQTDRIFLTNMVDVGTTGVYSIANQFGMMVELAAGAFNQAYVPWLYRNLALNDDAVKRRIVKLTYAYFAVIIAGALLLATVLPWFLSFWVGPKFVRASEFILWSALGYSCSGMYYMVANYLFYAEKTHALAAVTFTTALLNVGYNYVLIDLNGAVGAAQATALAFFTSFVLTWIVSARVYPMPWRLWRR